jgi:hypothetical protein
MDNVNEWMVPQVDSGLVISWQGYSDLQELSHLVLCMTEAQADQILREAQLSGDSFMLNPDEQEFFIIDPS